MTTEFNPSHILKNNNFQANLTDNFNNQIVNLLEKTQENVLSCAE